MSPKNLLEFSSHGLAIIVWLASKIIRQLLRVYMNLSGGNVIKIMFQNEKILDIGVAVK